KWLVPSTEIFWIQLRSGSYNLLIGFSLCKK
ncbi:hypothetical protein pipiens_007368, partial [Culex pipiens pipiens]